MLPAEGWVAYGEDFVQPSTGAYLRGTAAGQAGSGTWIRWGPAGAMSPAPAVYTLKAGATDEGSEPTHMYLVPDSQEGGRSAFR
ncbi:hypothetical protein NKH18_15100 [Streptomyces sp. M10(2022)]